MARETLTDRVAIVTGGNHGIGAATARALAARGARVLVSYFRLQDPADAAIPQTYRVNRAQDGLHVVEAIRATGGSAEALEADLRDPSTPGRLFDAAEGAFGRSRSWSTTPPAGRAGTRSGPAVPISMVVDCNASALKVRLSRWK